jgi:hypothetical protein
LTQRIRGAVVKLAQYVEIPWIFGGLPRRCDDVRVSFASARTILRAPAPSALTGEKIDARFEGGRSSSDGGVAPLCEADRGLNLCQRIADTLGPKRKSSRIASQPSLKEVQAFGVVTLASPKQAFGDAGLSRRIGAVGRPLVVNRATAPMIEAIVGGLQIAQGDHQPRRLGRPIGLQTDRSFHQTRTAAPPRPSGRFMSTRASSRSRNRSGSPRPGRKGFRKKQRNRGPQGAIAGGIP